MATDIHLSEMSHSRGTLLLKLIEQAAAWQVEYFLLGGDIFEFCQGSHPFFQAKFNQLGEALTRLAAAGTRVIFIEGNHEFDLAGLKWEGVDFVTEVERLIDLKNGTKVLVGHGDQIYNNLSYRLFRGLVKSGLVRWVARHLVPAEFLNWYTLRHSQASRAADRFRTLNHQALLVAMNRWVDRNEGAKHVLFGHFHVPYFQPRSTIETGYIASCESWERPNALVMMKDQFSRLFWDRHTQSWVRSPAIPLDLEGAP